MDAKRFVSVSNLEKGFISSKKCYVENIAKKVDIKFIKLQKNSFIMLWIAKENSFTMH